MLNNILHAITDHLNQNGHKVEYHSNIVYLHRPGQEIHVFNHDDIVCVRIFDLHMDNMQLEETFRLEDHDLLEKIHKAVSTPLPAPPQKLERR